MAHKPSSKPSSDRHAAARNLYNAKRRLMHAEAAIASTPIVEWCGTRTTEWDNYIAITNRLHGPKEIVDNLSALLSRDDGTDRYSCRRVGFNDNGSLVLDGDWFSDIDDNGEDYCCKCAADMLIEGGFDPAGLHACYAYIQDPDCQIVCTACEVSIRLGCDMYAIVLIADSEDEAERSEADPSSAVDFDPDSDPKGWDMDPDIEDGLQDNAIEDALVLHKDTGNRYQVRYICYDDPYNNSVVWDSAEAGSEAEAEASSARIVAAEAAIVGWQAR